MRNKKETLEEMLERIGVTAEWERRGEARGEKTGGEKALGLLKQGDTVDQLERMSSGGGESMMPGIYRMPSGGCPSLRGVP